MEALNSISRPAAWAIATVLNQASMDVTVIDRPAGPGFANASGAEVIAAAYAVIQHGGRLSDELESVDWLMVAFEGGQTDGYFHSAELRWKQ